MSTLIAGIGREHVARYFPSKRLARYVLANLKPGQFHIWVGNGSNGKSTFAQIVSNALFTMNPMFVSDSQILHTPIAQFGTCRLLLTHDWDDELVIPAARIQGLLDAGFLVIVTTNKLPVVRDPRCNMLSATHVIPFHSTFVREKNRVDPDEHIFATDHVALPRNTIMMYVNDRIKVLQNSNEVRRPSKSSQRMKEQLVMLAQHTADIDISDNVAKNLENNKNKNSSPPNLNVAEDPNLNVVEDTSYEVDDRHYSSITIILQHRVASRPDDVLTIAVDPDSDGFYVTLNQNFVGSTCTSYMLPDDLCDYLMMFFDTMRYDTDGYSHAQFNVPLFPSVITRIDRAPNYVVEHLTTQIEWLTEDWPSETVIGPFKTC